MPSFTSDARFFGLDLKNLSRQLREPWEGASAWPLFSWLSPSVTVRVLHADGREVLWTDGRGAFGSPSQAAPGRSERTGFVAVEIPDEKVLRRSVRLPAMAAADRDSALALEARTASPFAAVDTTWGASPHPTQNGVHTVAIASRKQLVEYLGALGSRLPQDAAPELWVFGDGGHPIVFAGFGESRRLAFIVRWRRTAYALLACAFGIAACIAVTPSIQLKLRADQAYAEYTRLVQLAAPVLAKREALVRSADQLSALQQRLAERIEPLRLLEVLTELMPDDTALQSFKLNGTKVTVAGLTANASTLMQLLGSQPGMRDVRAPSPATRLAGAQKETFVIEFVADPAHFGVRGGAPGDQSAPSAPTAAVNQAKPAGPSSGGVATGTAGAVPPQTQGGGEGQSNKTSAASSPVPAPTPVKRPPAASGGATFGGTAPRPANPPAAASGKGSAP